MPDSPTTPTPPSAPADATPDPAVALAEGARRQLVAADPLFGAAVADLPTPIPRRSQDLYLHLLRAISYQQLSGRAADTIFRRFLDLFPERYPTAERLAVMDLETLRAAGVSRQKGGYLRNIAAHALEHGFDHARLDAMSDDAILADLCRIKGVGNWTAEMLLMFALARPDVLPVDDLGIQQAMAAMYGLPETGRALRQRMVLVAEPWRPHRTMACSFLWTWYDRRRAAAATAAAQAE